MHACVFACTFSKCHVRSQNLDAFGLDWTLSLANTLNYMFGCDDDDKMLKTYHEMKMCQRMDHRQTHPLALNNAKRSKMLNSVSGSSLFSLHSFLLPYF